MQQSIGNRAAAQLLKSGSVSANPALAPAAPPNSPIQMIKVTREDVGKKFHIVTDKGVRCVGVLKSIDGHNGWFTFEANGEDVRVRGKDNIVSRATDGDVSDDRMDVDDGKKREPLSGDMNDFDVDEIAKEREIPRKDAVRLVRDTFHENPRTIRVRYSTGAKTIYRGTPGYENPEETRKGPQAMVSYRQEDYSDHKKVGKDYDEWADRLSDDEESEKAKKDRAKKMHDYLDTYEDMDFSDFSTEQKIAMGGLLSVSHISDPLRTDVDTDATERDFGEQLQSRAEGKTTFHGMFGSKTSSSFLPARTKGSSQQRKMLLERKTANGQHNESSDDDS